MADRRRDALPTANALSGRIVRAYPLAMDSEVKRIGRPPGATGAETFERIRSEGARLLAERGYGEMSLRDLAAQVGISAGSLYNYITSKQELLFLLLDEHMSLALATMRDALQATGGDPAAKLKSFIETHIEFHTHRPYEAAICLSELRSLTRVHRDEILRQRDAYEKILEDILRQGQLAGAFRVGDLRIETLAIFGMITGVLGWYRPGGRLGSKQISELIVRLLLRGLQP